MGRKSNGYYNLRENRLKELNNYIVEHKYIDNIYHDKDGESIYAAFNRRKESINNAIIDLGYDINDVRKTIPRRYYNDFSKIEEKLWDFINIHKRFPKRIEIVKDLKIDQRYIDKNGGINGLKSKINYIDDNDLIDDRGDYNKSLLEWQVANFLIAQGLKDNYKREQYPFPKEEGYFRSDFTFYIEDKELHIEVWGTDKNDFHDKRAKHYQETRIKKEHLYDKYNIMLISLEYEYFQTSYNDIIQYLYNKLNCYLILPFKTIDYNIIINPNTMTDDELFEEIMKFSNDDITFPVQNILNKYNSGIMKEIRKRGYTYLSFANKYSKKLISFSESWDKETIFKYFLIINNHGKQINTNNMKLYHGTLASQVNKHGIVNIKLEFFNKYFDQIINSDSEIKWLIDVINIKNNVSIGKITKSNIIEAKNILEKLNCENPLNKCCKLCGTFIDTKNIFDIYCSDCNEKLKFTKLKYFSIPKFNELELRDNFYLVIDAPYKLTTTGFNNNSNISSMAYYQYYKDTNWIDIIRIYKKLDELILYVKNEYLSWHKNTGNQNLSAFCKQHSYITYDLINNIGLDHIRTLCNIKKLRYSDEDYYNNFINIKTSLGYIPLYNEFENFTKITMNAYIFKFNLKGKIYDSIIKMYSTQLEYEEYKLRQKQHKSDIGKITGSNPIHTDNDLKINFIKIFDEYFIEYNKYPSRRNFNKLSSIDESTYRKRLDLSWGQVREFYGY